MQKRKIILTTLVALFSTSNFADEISTTGQNISPVPAPVQEHISKLMEEDMQFNQSQRLLSQQLALAKLRLEMAKIKNEAAELNPVSAMPIMNDGPSGEEPKTESAPVDEPRVMMLSQIAGITKAAVSVGTKTVFVRIGEVFSANGKRYTVHQDKNGQHSYVQEISR
ncbi:hypothetical protein [Rahnella sp. PD4]|uniref:hypothetical protein n=1 Tax=Rahnella sp. PD4 TaxID=3368611 RepID=UPI003B9FDA07